MFLYFILLCFYGTTITALSTEKTEMFQRKQPRAEKQVFRIRTIPE